VAFRETAGGILVYANSNHCGVTSAVMNPALTVSEGDQVTINLNYSLTNIIVDLRKL
jgi:acetamidase/formamidase